MLQIAEHEIRRVGIRQVQAADYAVLLNAADARYADAVQPADAHVRRDVSVPRLAADRQDVEVRSVLQVGGLHDQSVSRLSVPDNCRSGRQRGRQRAARDLHVIAPVRADVGRRINAHPDVPERNAAARE